MIFTSLKKQNNLSRLFYFTTAVSMLAWSEYTEKLTMSPNPDTAVSGF